MLVFQQKENLLWPIPFLFRIFYLKTSPVMLKRLNAYTKSYRKDEYIKHAGDPADFIGIIETGSIHVLQTITTATAISQPISRDSLFGEAFTCAGDSLSSCGHRGCGRLHRNVPEWKTLLNTCDNGCKFHHTLVRTMLGIVGSEQYVYLEIQKIKYTSRKTTLEKLMTYLNDQAKMKGPMTSLIPFNRQELADYLGVEKKRHVCRAGQAQSLASSGHSAVISPLIKNHWINF